MSLKNSSYLCNSYILKPHTLITTTTTIIIRVIVVISMSDSNNSHHHQDHHHIKNPLSKQISSNSRKQNSSSSKSHNKPTNKKSIDSNSNKTTITHHTTIVVQVDIENDKRRDEKVICQEHGVANVDCNGSSTDETQIPKDQASRTSSTINDRQIWEDFSSDNETSDAVVEILRPRNSHIADNGVLSENNKTKSISTPSLRMPSSRSSPSHSLVSGGSNASTINSCTSSSIYETCPSSFSSTDTEIYYSATSIPEALENNSELRLPNIYNNETCVKSLENMDTKNPHLKMMSLQKGQKFPSTPTSLSVSSCYKTNQQRQPSSNSKNLTNNFRSNSVRLKRKQIKSLDDEDITVLKDDEDELHSIMNRNRVWLYKSSNDSKYPDIILHMNGDGEGSSKQDDENKRKRSLLLPLLNSPLFQLNLERYEETQVYMEYNDDDNEPRRHARHRSGGRSIPNQNPPRRTLERLYERHSTRLDDSDRTSVTGPGSLFDFSSTRAESMRKLSSISRVLVVDENNQYEDLLHVQIDALERRLSRDNLRAINLLNFLGDELSINSGDVTPVGFEYSDNALKIRFLISWKSALVEPKHKKKQLESEVPLGATTIYCRPISKWRRILRRIRFRLITCARCCLSIFKRHHDEDDESSEENYERELIKVESVEAFQQEMDVMENMHGLKRLKAKRHSALETSDSLEQLNEFLNTVHDHDKKHNYRNAKSLRN